MSAPRRTRRRHVLALPLVALMGLAAALGGQTHTAVGQGLDAAGRAGAISQEVSPTPANYAPPPLILTGSAADTALRSASTSAALVDTATAVAEANAASGAVLQDAVVAAFSNPNAASDPNLVAEAFITGFVAGTTRADLGDAAAGQLAHALLQADVRPLTILMAALTATGESLGTARATDQFCTFLGGLLAGPGATDETTFTVATESMAPNPLFSCGFASPPPAE